MLRSLRVSSTCGSSGAYVEESQRNHRRDMIESAKRFQEMRSEYDDILQQEMDEIEQSRIHRNDVRINDGALTRLANRRIQDREKRKFQDRIAELTQMCTYRCFSSYPISPQSNHLHHSVPSGRAIPRR